MTLWQLFFHQRTELLGLILEHLFLVGLSIGIAVLIGVPLGMALTRRPGLSRPVLTFANIMQTIPSLALFGFLIPLNLYLFHLRILGGIGAHTAIVALVLYSLLPIIRNTYAGIVGVDPAVREAARGMGMTDRQLLFQVEVPLALGVIVAGVRVAAVIAVGTATIAAAIDAGGLGRYIFRGLRMNNNALILAGALPAALMALVADFLLGRVERFFGKGVVGHPKTLKIWGAIAGLLVAGSIAFWIYPSKVKQALAVGSKDFTEQLILGEMVAQVVESEAGIPVERHFDLGGHLAHEALAAGEIDLYVEYTGTAWTAILGRPPLKDRSAVYRQVREEYDSRLGIEWTEPLGFENTFAILVRGEDARRLDLKTVSDIRRHAPKWRAGFGQDFMSRPDGYDGFVRAYGVRFAEVREMDLSLTYRALAEGQVDLIVGNSTDGLIPRYGLVQLADDLSYFPPYDAVPLIRQEALERHPGVRGALRMLGGILSVEKMRNLNFQVDGRHRPVREVVEDFLREKNLTR